MNAPEQTVQHVKTAVDSALASGAISAPLWMQYLQTYGSFLMLVGGVVLLTIRIAIAWDEWRAKRRKANDGS